eukprot:2299792-Rhodomonas_salina.2
MASKWSPDLLRGLPPPRWLTALELAFVSIKYAFETIALPDLTRILCNTVPTVVHGYRVPPATRVHGYRQQCQHINTQ